MALWTLFIENDGAVMYSYIFQKITIYNDQLLHRNKWQCYLLKVMNKKIKYKKKTVPLFWFLEGQMHQYQSVYFHFYATDMFKQY